MKFYLWISALLLVVIGTNSQDFDLFDALGDDDPTPAPKVPDKPKPKPNDGGLDLLDAFGPDPVAPTKAPPKKPADNGLDLGDFDLGDAFGPDPDPTPAKPRPPKPGGGGGSFDDADLWDPSKGNIDEPQGGGGGGGGHDYGGGGGGGGGSDQTKEAGGGQIAGIASAIGVALMGAASGYIAYQKKKLCFKIQGGTDPESGKNYEGNRGAGAHHGGGGAGGGGGMQMLTNLLRSTQR